MNLRRTVPAGWLLLLGLVLPGHSTPVNLTVDATQLVRPVDDRVFGVNAVIWDSAFNTPQTISLLRAADVRALRFPGGSLSDEYHWKTNTSLNYTWTWVTGFDAFANVAVSLRPLVFITVNYGTGTAQEAADWVTNANLTRGLGIKYWEIGNECYGTWETDHQAIPWDPYTYASRARDYITAMKAVDPTIRIGVVATTGEDAYANNTSHPATNPRTGRVHNGWTPVMLTTLRSLGVTPDFLIYHRYEQGPGQESDAGLLQSALTWPNDAADLRQQLSDYLGAAGAGVELVVTENNSVYANPGKQTTSLVNGLFLADSIGNLLQTEFTALIWWALRNGPENGNNNSATLYGWRDYGDYGVLSIPSSFGSSTYYDPYPTYYAMKLLSHFARGGDTIVRATSDNDLLAIYAARRGDGSLSLLVINKSPSETLTAIVAVKNFTPPPTATVYSYGMPQDDAARTGTGSPDIALSSLGNVSPTFTASFMPYSATILSLAPGAPVITTQPASQTAAVGSNVQFSVVATGTPAPAYQWNKNGVALNGANSASLTLTNVQMTDAGDYTVTVSNSVGGVTSDKATLTVNAAPPSGGSSGGGGGGGGGAIEAWFVLALALLGFVRGVAHRRACPSGIGR
jgi:hypothetical protein